jgi:prevent-host-death family protein
MRQAGVREARQNLSKLLREVRQGREIVITERGVAVARLVPMRPQARRGFPDLSTFRAKMPVLAPPLSATVAAERDEE